MKYTIPWKGYAIILILIVVLFAHAQPTHAATIAEVEHTQWPVSIDQPWTYVSSPFGPRIQASEDNRYDFHRGIDIPGTTTDAVRSINTGKIFRIYRADDPNSPYPNSGNVVIVQHRFRQPYPFHGQLFTNYYSVYAHLDSIDAAVQEGVFVQRQTLLGFIGKTGNASYMHLHFEIRIGTTCSFESSCSKGYDPHVNPLLFLPYPNKNSDVVTADIGDNGEIVVQTQMPRTELDLNRFELHTVQKDMITNQEPVILDYNTREGFDASSTETLDQAVMPAVAITPFSFTSTTPTQNTVLNFVPHCDSSVDSLELRVYDIWNNPLFIGSLSCKK